MLDVQGGNDKSNEREDDEDAVQTQPLDKPLQQTIEIIEQTRRQCGFAERDTAHGKKDDRPVKRVKVLLQSVSTDLLQWKETSNIPLTVYLSQKRPVAG